MQGLWSQYIQHLQKHLIKEFTKMLVSNAISMDGCAYDNIFIERFWRTLKYEWLYLNSYLSIRELKVGLQTYLEFYNSKRIHQSLGYKTQDGVYWHNVSTGGKTGGAALPNMNRPAEKPEDKKQKLKELLLSKKKLTEAERMMLEIL